MDKSETLSLLKEITSVENIKTEEMMNKHTSFKIGGPADFLVTPASSDELCLLIIALNKNEVPYFVMGNGSNLLVREKGIRGVVIKLFDNFNEIKIDGDIIIAEAGALLSKIARVALDNDLAGFEFASGIPGTLGGAVVMNAGAYSGEMKDVIIKSEYIDRQGNVRELTGNMHEFGYRKSVFQRNGGIVTNSLIKLAKGDRHKIKATMDDFNGRRRDKQPLAMPSAGSVFRRPEGHFAGKMIEDCGMRGKSIGGAQVSTKHCGFIVNTGNATASDVIDLINKIKDKVKEKFGVSLETEIKFVGEE
ncbi:MAG: UDP-N-acetylmuramate dehydrogenase [Clostridia bacterium]